MFPRPAYKKTVRKFLGQCAYYRRFVRHFTSIAAPLTHFTKVDVDLKWETRQGDTFGELKPRLQSPPVLSHFDEDAEMKIHTEPSSVGLGAMLVQRTELKA